MDGQPCAHQILAHPQPSTQTPSWLSTRALRAIRAHPSWKQPHPSSGFCGKSKSTASLGTASPVCVTAQVTPTTASRQGRTDPRGAKTSRDPSLSQEPPQRWGHSGPEKCPALTLLTPKAVIENTAGDKATTWHRKGWKPTTFPHVPFLSTVPVSLVPTATGICESQDFM